MAGRKHEVLLDAGAGQALARAERLRDVAADVDRGDAIVGSDQNQFHVCTGARRAKSPALRHQGSGHLSYVAHSPSVVSGLNAFVSARSMKSSSVAVSLVNTSRSARSFLTCTASTRLKNAAAVSSSRCSFA